MAKPFQIGSWRAWSNRRRIVVVLAVVALCGLLAFCMAAGVQGMKEVTEADSLGFADPSEMADIQGEGWHTKAAFLRDIAAHPLKSPDAEMVAECGGLARRWEESSLDEKAGVEVTQPAKMSKALVKLQTDYAVGGTTLRDIGARTDSQYDRYTKQFGTEGLSQNLITAWAACKAKFAQAVVAKCGEDGDCDKKDEKESVRNHFLF